MIDPAQPAFPEVHIHHFQNEDKEGKHDNVVPRWMGGLTKREYFAAIAMQGTLANGELMKTIDDKCVEANIPTQTGTANFAIQCADALTAGLSK